MATLKLGSLLDRRYRVVQTLAKGGFGQTYIAEDTRRPGNPRCVVKHLRPASNDSKFLENARRLFSTEAEILEKLGTHDQIPRLLAYFEEEQEFYLVQDLIEGHTLTHELHMGYRWSEAQVCQLLQDVLNVLAFVHHHGVIHRDIKPENLIRRQPDNKLILVDFGTVKQVRIQQVTSGQANLTIAVGTPGYMPTEQNHGKPRPNSDLYALGIIGLQAATGLLPGQLQDDVDTGELVWQPWAQQIRGDLAAILDRLVRYHFKDRYQSAVEVLQAMDELFTQHPDLLAAVESQPPPDIASMKAATKSGGFSHPPSPIHSVPATSATGPLIVTGLVNPSETSITSVTTPSATNESSRKVVVTQMENVSVDLPITTLSEQPKSGTPQVESEPTTLKQPPASVPSQGELDSSIPSGQPETASQERSPLPSQSAIAPPSQPPKSVSVKPLITAPPITKIDAPQPRLTQLRAALPLSRITTQPTWMGIGATVLALLIGIPTLLKVLPMWHSPLSPVAGFRTVFTPAQQSLSKVLLTNLPCQALQPKTQLTNPLTYPDGTQYFGVLKDGLPNDPRGALLFRDGGRYDGELQNGKFNGCGQYTYPTNVSYSYYIGQFQNNAFNGLGTLSFAGGDRYIGEFRNGKCHGQGTFISANGAFRRSNWQDGNSVDGDSTLSCIRR
ncbi:MAG: protein kinase [Oculatellaceae cyanobacterium bins.114]|nr:protein kinase [Oculatellaceae cyanobacterium bins.114]